MAVIATAGHIDHGKSALVRALTGTDPDRLAQEQERGMTLDLGFAVAQSPSGHELSFVDVPGHARLVRTMLAGVGAVDACLFVVAANEGWKPQSEEHLAVLEVIGIRRAVVAVSKVGLTDPAQVDATCRQVVDRLAHSTLAGAPVVQTDACSRIGLDELMVRLDTLAAMVPLPPDTRRPRLWIDRAFAIRGAGTVVTGTLAGGALQVRDVLEVSPGPGPSYRPLGVKVRGLESNHQPVESAQPGRRVAVNLTGVDRHALQRGQALVRPAQWAPTTVVDASLSVLESVGRQAGRRGAYHAHFGTAEVVARLRVIAATAIDAGSSGMVRLHLPVPLPLLPGDRYVLRESGRAETIGGGEVLDVAPVLPASRARPDRDVARVVRERGWVEPELLAQLTGVPVTPTVGRWVVDPGALERAVRALSARIHDAGALGLDCALLSERDQAVLPLLANASVRNGRVQQSADAADAADRALRTHPYLQALDAAPFSPPEPGPGVPPSALRALVRAGLVVGSQGQFYSANAVAAAAATIQELLGAHPAGVRASEVRQALGTSRKYVLPLLAHLDAVGATRRREDLRIAGPRLAEVAGSGDRRAATGSANSAADGVDLSAGPSRREVREGKGEEAP